jgi:two-component system CheB/CheR fusion protein
MDNEFESLLDYLKQARGFDFAAYKRTTLTRRVDHRMQQVDIKSYADYVDFLEVHPDEFAQLFNTILINVTSFFRDESAWDYLAQEIIPGLLAAKGDESRVRAWVAGCAA